MLITTYAFWLLLGIFLLLSELIVPGVIVAFFGIGALVVGLLTLTGLIDSLPIQLAIFLGVSLLSLFTLRKRFERWMKGAEADKAVIDEDNAGFVGARVKVLSDFVQGAGTVELNGAKWDAESSDELKMGDTAWVHEHKGITLVVSRQKP